MTHNCADTRELTNLYNKRTPLTFEKKEKQSYYSLKN